MGETISSRQNSKVKRCIKLLKSPDYRLEQGCFVLEGARLCDEALKSGIKIQELFFSKRAQNKHTDIISRLQAKSLNHYLVEESLTKNMTDTSSSQGIICVCGMPAGKQASVNHKKGGNCLGLENIQDPSNLGSIFRTAAALDFRDIIINEGSCDIYSPKALRAAMGATFKLNIEIVGDMAKKVEELNRCGYDTYAAVVSDSAAEIREIDFKDKNFVAMGNEGNGLTQNTIDACKAKFTIPINKDTESLNVSVAAGITIWEMVR